MAVSGRFVALLALGVVPVVLLGELAGRALETLLVWIALGIALLVLDLLSAASPRAVRLERSIPGRLRLGETAPSILYLTHTGRRMLRAVVRDAWQPSAGASTTRSRVDVPPGERRAVTVQLTPFRRGERRTERVTIRSWGPLGLAARQATLLSPGRIRVLPPFNSRKHLPSRLARLRELDGRTSVMIRGQGTEFDSLREYVRGDDVRSIDWRATARHSDVMVRTWRPERDRRVVVVIDTGRTQAARIDDEPRLDTAFESALLLAALATRAGDRVDLVLYDRRLRGRVHGASGPALLAGMVDAMAPVEPELIEMDWTAVPGLVRQVTTQRSLVVLCTSIDSPGSARELMAMVPELTKNHLVVVSSVTDPDVLAASLERGDREQVYRAASAERALLDTARVTSVLHRYGADVVTGSPAELPPALADRYLALKAAGRL
ncbi:DUF58 domain-containing protein [Herbiconiux moechotypicola]|uniref:DUF58 domain-containing protein n=1 Tax=Herbiconiux moechotypicola TaxID=637393 RepID=A0ABN3DUC3_9MICO|nr:DUF58 domain-containing protein [Herbiconiux moechotypicola]MCS5731042.1 DUF58 domain-containing protein [Herbiconiux moechotypicola]